MSIWAVTRSVLPRSDPFCGATTDHLATANSGTLRVCHQTDHRPQRDRNNKQQTANVKQMTSRLGTDSERPIHPMLWQIATHPLGVPAKPPSTPASHPPSGVGPRGPFEYSCFIGNDAAKGIAGDDSRRAQHEGLTGRQGETSPSLHAPRKPPEEPTALHRRRLSEIAGEFRYLPRRLALIPIDQLLSPKR